MLINFCSEILKFAKDETEKVEVINILNILENNSNLSRENIYFIREKLVEFLSAGIIEFWEYNRFYEETKHLLSDINVISKHIQKYWPNECSVSNHRTESLLTYIGENTSPKYF